VKKFVPHLRDMAAYSVEPHAGWMLQTRSRAALPQQTPSAMSATLFGSTGNFAGWTSVPQQPKADPFIADQTRPGRRVLTGPSSDFAPEPFGGGKRQVGPHHSAGMPAGKRAFPEEVSRRSSDVPPPHGLKRVETRARSDRPALSNPNSAVTEGLTFKPEGVKFFPGMNQVRRMPSCQPAAGPSAHEYEYVHVYV
jgi:hypothetical protein